NLRSVSFVITPLYRAQKGLQTRFVIGSMVCWPHGQHGVSRTRHDEVSVRTSDTARSNSHPLPNVRNTSPYASISDYPCALFGPRCLDDCNRSSCRLPRHLQ